MLTKEQTTRTAGTPAEPTLRDATLVLLDRAEAFVAQSPWKNACLLRLQQLRQALSEPCVLAVAGRVKAGKSTLVNALLGETLALEGATETTATITFFRYGVPPYPDRPVRCVWRNGRPTWETRDFLDGLQGTTDESLRRAENIAQVEFFVPNPDLRDVVLVDTPGTDAIVGDGGDSHQRVVDGFFAGEETLSRDAVARVHGLQSRHSEETATITRTADAVIYLVGQVAHISNQEFLREFQQASSGQTRALNAVGVLSKTDLLDEILERRHELALAVAEKLRDELNTVVPTSAALWRATRLLQADMAKTVEMKRQLTTIPEDRFVRMLSSDRAFLRDYDDCPLSPECRRAMLGRLPWRVFVVVARTLRRSEPDQAISELQALSGFPDLQRLIHNHFFRRAQLLKCFRIIADARSILDDLHRRALMEYRSWIKRQRQELVEFTDFIISHPHGTSDTANRLRRALEMQVPEDQTDRLHSELERLLAGTEELQESLEHINQQFKGLQLLEDADAMAFTQDERQELRTLFGLYAGGPTEPPGMAKVAARQIFWRQVALETRDRNRRQVAELAGSFYGREIKRLVGR